MNRPSPPSAFLPPVFPSRSPPGPSGFELEAQSRLNQQACVGIRLLYESSLLERNMYEPFIFELPKNEPSDLNLTTQMNKPFLNQQQMNQQFEPDEK